MSKGVLRSYDMVGQFKRRVQNEAIQAMYERHLESIIDSGIRVGGDQVFQLPADKGQVVSNLAWVQKAKDRD